MISRDQYEQLLDDRPDKFDAEEVGFVKESNGAHVCCSCIHFFHNPARSTTVCEIYRPDPEDNIPPLGGCNFWTPDGRRYPLLEDRDGK